MTDKKEKKEKEKKKKPDKYNGFHVYSKSGDKSTRCTAHIYDMIKEANSELLTREDVKKAFNDFVACLKKHDKLESYSSKVTRFIIGIKILENTEKNCFQNVKNLNCRFTYENDRYRDSEIKAQLMKECADVIDSYIPLYDLIKRDVVPYMEFKQWEIQSKKDIEMYHRLIEREETVITNYQNAIDSSRERMCEYARKALDLHNPPQRTTFE